MIFYTNTVAGWYVAVNRRVAAVTSQLYLYHKVKLISLPHLATVNQ